MTLLTRTPHAWAALLILTVTLGATQAGCLKSARSCTNDADCFAGEVCMSGGQCEKGIPTLADMGRDMSVDMSPVDMPPRDMTPADLGVDMSVDMPPADLGVDMGDGELTLAGRTSGDPLKRLCPASSSDMCMDGSCCVELPPPEGILPAISFEAQPEVLGIFLDARDRLVVVYLERTTSTLYQVSWLEGAWKAERIGLVGTAGQPTSLTRRHIAIKQRADRSGIDLVYIHEVTGRVEIISRLGDAPWSNAYNALPDLLSQPDAIALATSGKHTIIGVWLPAGRALVVGRKETAAISNTWETKQLVLPTVLSTLNVIVADGDATTEGPDDGVPVFGLSGLSNAGEARTRFWDVRWANPNVFVERYQADLVQSVSALSLYSSPTLSFLIAEALDATLRFFVIFGQQAGGAWSETSVVESFPSAHDGRFHILFGADPGTYITYRHNEPGEPGRVKLAHINAGSGLTNTLPNPMLEDPEHLTGYATLRDGELLWHAVASREDGRLRYVRVAHDTLDPPNP